MMMTNFRPRLMGLLLAATLLTACDGEEGGDEPPQDTNGTLVVWARGANPSFGTPITVFVGNEQVGPLAANAPSSQTNPSGTAGPSEVRLTRPAGSYRIRAVSAIGQVWTANVTLTAGQTATQLLENNATAVGRASFWAQSGGNVTSAITVILDVNDTLGTVASTSAAAPACADAATATGLRASGVYSYRAINAAGNCTWTGSFTIPPNNGCQQVQLSPCSQ